jgi:hypothetical protein
MYYLTEVTSATPETIISNFNSLTISDIFNYDVGLSPNTLMTFCSCTIHTTMKELLDSMLHFRVTKSVCVNEIGRFVCFIDIKDILNYFLTSGSIR